MDRSKTNSALPGGWLADGVHPVGYSELDGRPGFKLSIRRAGDRRYLYLGHFWHSGWSVVDVTGPPAPEVINFVPGPTNTATLLVDLAGPYALPGIRRWRPRPLRGNPASSGNFARPG